MNICENPDELLSALYDGEPVPTEFAQHVDICPNCRARLLDYSRMGAELRLMASLNSNAPVPRMTLRRSRFFDFTGKITIPKLAIAGAAALFIVMTVGLVQLHARQSNPLWFQFTLTEKGKDASGGLPSQYVAQAGYDDYSAGGDGQTVIGRHLAVSHIETDQVTLAIRARAYHQVTNAADLHLNVNLKDMTGKTLTYIPGQPLEIPMEGGGTLILQGKVIDHQPRFREFGIPLEPAPDQIIIGSPVLISGDRVLANMQGANTIQEGRDRAAVLYVRGAGLLKFALQPFPGAIEGKASWGRLEFKLDNQQYTLLTVSQICGGDQPRTVWISDNANFTHDSPWFVSGDSLSNPSWR